MVEEEEEEDRGEEKGAWSWFGGVVDSDCGSSKGHSSSCDQIESLFGKIFFCHIHLGKQIEYSD